ncbi:hypothetical protein GCM10018781_28480 [Kitasatospora indigofera]|uniref:Uncharacterized protein n=1 Tax=Kitasatospora indigofera TaxID=67307 RepID=A0A919KRQ7_9ACTN|nr:hypothetical protein GCM10018781_28480 [Kitasatospora indigofera]
MQVQAAFPPNGGTLELVEENPVTGGEHVALGVCLLRRWPLPGEAHDRTCSPALRIRPARTAAARARRVAWRRVRVGALVAGQDAGVAVPGKAGGAGDG